MSWLKSALLERWLGRLIVLGLAALGGWLSKYIEPALVASWLDATKALLEALLPILLAWLLGAIRHKIALNTEPPEK